jgi:hypothetical protein
VTYDNLTTPDNAETRCQTAPPSPQVGQSEAALAGPAPSALAVQVPTERSKGGAPAGNRNSYRHGLYSPRGPQTTIHVDRAANKFRRHLEDQVLALHGEISTLAAALIQTAAEASRVALAEMTELAKLADADKLDPQQRTAKRQAALKALDLRDRKVRELGITWAPSAAAGPVDPWSDFDQERKLASLPTDNTPVMEPA